MRVLVVYVDGMLRAETLQALQASKQPAWDLVMEQVPYGHSTHDGSYHNIIAREWSHQQGVVVVEQDNVIRPGCVEELWSCPEDWCGFPYVIGKSEHKDCLGCTKLSPQLMRTHPSLMDDLALVQDGCPAKCWHRVDSRMATRLHVLGYKFHAHYPIIEHLHRY